MSEEDRFLNNLINLCDFSIILCQYCIQQGYNDSKISSDDLKSIRDILRPEEPVIKDRSGNIIPNNPLLPKEAILRNFMIHSIKYWEYIRLKDETFFHKNIKSIFNGLPVSSTQIEIYSKLYEAKDKDGNKYIKEEHIKRLWLLFNNLVKLCIKYSLRHPEFKDKVITSYNSKKHNFVLDFDKIVSDWNVKL